jgi:hypothetical protein
MSLGMMVTRLAWMAAKLVSSKRPTRKRGAPDSFTDDNGKEYDALDMVLEIEDADDEQE